MLICYSITQSYYFIQFGSNKDVYVLIFTCTLPLSCESHLSSVIFINIKFSKNLKGEFQSVKDWTEGLDNHKKGNTIRGFKRKATTDLM